MSEHFEADDLSNSTRAANSRDETIPRSSEFEALIASKPGLPSVDELLSYLEERIAVRMPSDLKRLDCVLDYLNERMLRLGIVESCDSEVMIALDEAIVNAIKHGNKCDARKEVHIVAEFNADGARFTIKDEGPGFEREKVPDPTDPSRLLEPSGRGLLLINHIMDEVCFNQCGNEVRMFKRKPVRIISQDPSSPRPLNDPTPHS